MGTTTASEMIAKVKVSGMTEFKSDMTNMKVTIETTAKTAEQHAKMFKHLTSSLNDLGQSSQSSGSLLTSGIMAGLGPLGVLLGVVAAGATAAAAAFIGFTKAAVGEAISIQKVTATYAALSGGMDAAAQKMKFLETFSKKSINQFDDLAEAGTLLEASGLRVERFVKSIDQMSGLFGGGKENVMELSEAIARMASGSMGEAERVFRKFGVTTADFMREGLRVGSGGQIEGTAEQMLSAWERIAKRKAGPLGDAIKDGMTLKFSNLQDAWKKMLDGFGKAWFPLIGKIVDSVTQFASFLNDTDFFKGIGEKFAKSFDVLLGVGDGQGIVKFMAFLAAGVERLPDLFNSLAEAGKGFLQWVGDGIVSVYNMIGQGAANLMNFMKHSLRQGVNEMRALAADILDYGKHMGLFKGIDTDAMRIPLNSRTAGALGGKNATFTPANNLSELIGGSISKLMNAVGAPFGGMSGDLNKRSAEIFKEYQKYLKKPGEEADGSKYPMYNDSYTAQIARNTLRAAENTAHMADFKRLMAGGGDLAAMGVTPAEMYAGRQHEITVNAGSRALNEALQHMIMDAITQIQRQNGRSYDTRVS